jgi:hypothetical protein
MVHPSSPPRRQSRFQIWRNRVWWVIWGLFCVMWLVMCLRGRQPSDPPLPLTANIGRGGIIMGVELPGGPPNAPRRFFITYKDSRSSFPQGYWLLPNNREERLPLTDAEWQPLEALHAAVVPFGVVMQVSLVPPYVIPADAIVQIQLESTPMGQTDLILIHAAPQITTPIRFQAVTPEFITAMTRIAIARGVSPARDGGDIARGL